MKILVMSDTHGQIGNAIDIIDQLKDIDRIIHLGDMVSDAQDIENIYKNIQVDYVKGNCDFHENGFLKEKILEILGRKLLLTHGHYYGVKYEYGEIYRAGKSKNVDAVLFGHTHIPYIDYRDNLLLFNPGSIALTRSGKYETYGILEVGVNTPIKVSLHEIKKNKKRC